VARFASKQPFSAESPAYRAKHHPAQITVGTSATLSARPLQGGDQDGYLKAYEVYNLKLNAELVVLSSCRTALGKEVKGEGLVGLTRGFMYARAARVLASLWNVSDEATAELMADFYHDLLGSRQLSPAAAIRAAQIKLLKVKRWESPYYWAGFTLQGEPK
jgi:CHAT domain-containing protein